MPRTQKAAAKSGRAKQRPTAKARRHGRNARPTSTDRATEALQARFADERTLRIGVAQLERFDIDGFVRETNDIALPTAERLRLLAVGMMLAASSAQPRGWLALRRLFEAAERACRSDVERWQVLASKAIAAHRLGNGFHSRDRGEGRSEGRIKKRVLDDAYQAALRLRELRPEHADSYSLVCKLYYEDADISLEEALRESELALQKNPENFWGRWYRAWCLRDLGRWSEAVDAFSRLSSTEFTGARAARYEHLLSGRAYCLMRAGEREAGEEAIAALLDRYQGNAQLAKQAPWRDLIRMATELLEGDLALRARALIARNVSAQLASLR